MVTLKLALDAQGFKAGAAGVVGDLRSIQQEAQKTASAVDIYGSGAVVRNWDTGRQSVLQYGKAIEAVGEVSQIGGRVRLLGEQVRNLGSGFGSAAGVAQTFAGALVDVAQVTQKTEGNLKAFGAALRANPILAAAGVISLIASAMQLFGSETRDANVELERQVKLQEDLRRASTDLATQLQRNIDLERIGFGVDKQEQGFLRARRLAEVASGLAGQQGFQTFADLQGLTGFDEQTLRALVGRAGIAEERFTYQANVRGTVTTTRELGITNEAAREVLLLLAQNLRENAATIQRELVDVRGYDRPIGPEVGPGYMTPDQLAAYQSRFRDPTVGTYTFGRVGYGSQIGPAPAEESPFARVSRLSELQDAERQLTEFNERLAQTKQLGIDVGTALGNSFFSFLQNASNARGVLVALLQQLAAIAQNRIVSGFANSVGNLFASTVTQNTQAPDFVGPPTPAGFQPS